MIMHFENKKELYKCVMAAAAAVVVVVIVPIYKVT